MLDQLRERGDVTVSELHGELLRLVSSGSLNNPQLQVADALCRQCLLFRMKVSGEPFSLIDDILDWSQISIA